MATVHEIVKRQGYLAPDEMASMIVGHKDDPAAQKLFEAALQYPSEYKRLEWRDLREGRLPNPDVQYPELARPAVFICTSHSCSAPLFDADKVPNRVESLFTAGLTKQ